MSAAQWVNVNFAMPGNEKCLASLLFPSGKRKTIVAFYAKRYTIESSCDDGYAYEYGEDDDECYLKEGWYESIQNWGDFSSVAVCEGEITHWMPLPDHPQLPHGDERK